MHPNDELAKKAKMSKSEKYPRAKNCQKKKCPKPKVPEKNQKCPKYGASSFEIRRSQTSVQLLFLKMVPPVLSAFISLATREAVDPALG